MRKPAGIFDRELEWNSLAAFVTGESRRARFGVVYGRRRQGKSWLLERLASRAAGWYWEAVEATTRQQLDDFARHFERWAKLPVRPRFENWSEAFDALWNARPPLLVLDEFQYLLASTPEVASVLQARVSRQGGPRVIVCGSALGPMRRLIASDAPLRGRASLELVVKPFDYRTAARYWRMRADWTGAMKLHALLGGTPAYLDFAAGRTPSNFETFDDWVCRVLLDPAGALFREGRILADDPLLQDRGLYRGILAAVAGGSTRRGQIAAALGRPDNTLAHPLNALVDVALLERVTDPLRARRSYFRFAEPLLRAYTTLIAPHESEIEHRGARHVWNRLREGVAAQILGPHFEQLARDWVARYASEETLGGPAAEIGPSFAHDPESKKELDLDVVVSSGREVVALGEAKWTNAPVGTKVLLALERKRTLLGAGAARAKLLLFSRTGFDERLTSAVRRRTDVELISAKRLYTGT